MSETINALKDTPIPTILICSGLFCILLGFINKLGGWIEVQPTQQKWAIPVGLGLLTIGIIFWQASNPNSEIVTSTDAQRNSEPFPTNGESSLPPVSPQESATTPQLSPPSLEPSTQAVAEDKDSERLEPINQSSSLMPPIDFLEKHYSDMKKIVAVDDINSLENLYSTRYDDSFLSKTSKDSYVKFWINEVSNIDKFSITPSASIQNEFQVNLCVQRNGTLQTFTFFFPLIQEGSTWLIGEGKNTGYQRGCKI